MIVIPEPIEEQLELGAAVAVSISGGKDSQALLKAVTQSLRSKGYRNVLFAIHAHLGRTEWPQTMDHCRWMCEEMDVPLVVVKRERGDLLDRWKERQLKLEGTGKPFWSSAKARYCTSDLKRGPINKYLRKFDRVISVEGIRSQESPARKKKPLFRIRKEITTQTRMAYTWYAIKDWTEEQVWNSWGQTRLTLNAARVLYKNTNTIYNWWNFHPAYAMGNNRLSCVICILQNKNDRRNGIKNAVPLARELSQMEQESGFSFWPDMSVTELLEGREK